MSTISYKSFDPENLKFSTPEENKKNPNITKYQLMSWPVYLKDNKEFTPQIQGPWMTLSDYGIPPKTDKTGKLLTNQAGIPLTDKERGRLRIPFNLDDPEQKRFYDALVSIDQKCENSREAIFGDKKKANSYRYAPVVRQPAPKLDDDEEDDSPPKPEYFVVKFDFDYENSSVKTKVYVTADGERKEVETPSLDEVQKYVRYKCEFRPIFAISKLYASKAPGDDGKRKYGLAFKLKHIEVKPSQLVQQEVDDSGFVDDDDDEGVERRVLVSEASKVSKQAEKQVEKQEDSEEEESEDTPPPTTKKTTTPAPTKKEEPKKAMKAPQPEPEESEEEDRPPTPPPASKAPRKRGTRTAAV